MTRLAVLAGFGSTVFTSPPSITWTDITQWVDIVDAGVQITRGASDEVSEIDTSTCTLWLDNSDGRFTPDRAASPYSPNVRRNTPIRVAMISADKNLLINPSFEDNVTEWVSSGVPTRVADSTHVQHGTFAMKITWGASAGQYVTSPTAYGLDIGATYTFSAYVWVPAGDAPVRLEVAGGAAGSQSTTFDAFQRITVTFTATSTSHQFRVAAPGTPAAGDLVWVDALQLEEGASVTAFDSNGAQQHERFWGMVNDWPITFEGLNSKVQIVCSDIFKLLSTQPQLRSLLTQEILYYGASAYYPLNETGGSASGGDLSGAAQSALAVQQSGSGGTLEFGDGSAPAETGDTAPLFTPASASAGKYLRADLNAAFVEAGLARDLVIEAWFSTSTQGRNLVTVYDTGDLSRIIVYLQSGTGFLTIESRDPNATSTYTVGATNLADGNVHHVLVVTETGRTYVDGVDIGVAVLVKNFDYTRLVVGASHTGSNLWSGSISHVALYANHTVSTSQMAADHYTAGATGFAGEDANDRIERLASYTGVASVTVFGTAFDPVASQGSGGDTALAMMRNVARTESAQLFAEKDYYGITVMGRDQRYNPSPAYTVAYAELETDSIRLSADDQKMANSVVASRPGGATQRVINQASIDAYGPKERPLELLKTSDNSVLDAANWIISRYADPPVELREVPIEAFTLGWSAYRSLLLLGLSDVVKITAMPDQAPASEQTLFIEGYTETIKRKWHLLQWRTSRSYNDNVWVLDDPVYSVLGTTTRLAY